MLAVLDYQRETPFSVHTNTQLGQYWYKYVVQIPLLSQSGIRPKTARDRN